MKSINDIIKESAKDSHGEWCLWDYKENGVHEILIWKGDGKDQSEITDIDEHGLELMNVPFETMSGYCEKHKNDNVDKWHLDFSNEKIKKIPSIFK